MESIQEMQRKRIASLEQQLVDVNYLLCKEVELAVSLSLVLTHLTNADFMEYLGSKEKLNKDLCNWNDMISEYLESERCKK